MKKSILIILVGLLSGLSYSQTYEIGPFLGGSNIVGDVGADNYIRPNKLAYGLVAKWNVSTRYSFRGSLMYSKLHADDSKSDMSSRQQRGYDVDCKLLEGSLGLEFNFWEFDLHKFSRPFTPYMYSGVSVFGHDLLYFQNGEALDYGNHITFAIPMILGVKAKLNQHLVLAAEVGARYTFTDDLDGSNPTGSLDDNLGLKFGNINSNDWYVFSGVTLTYTFGRRPCYYCPPD
ncbi:hypothetical protein SAMN04487906_1041 [Zhouia amylolytica]|uniref:DUF6089 domain-containing protein n=1 Tax=Zhouia amylolytica TaxID=376730 RepID=A0A1I6RF15_9FLAO|nr:DUF6089 family protein [Zhouia amylolytica]MCQ0110645.1 hypothetical protein [Zhouia amylolytica]SFS63264.1 hypothetical protein SAMN04487906_1041 [Zhouia amylolytica]